MATEMRLFLDVTRIATRVLFPTPTGIDRVEFAYASEILRHYPDLAPVPTITTPYFTGAVRATTILEMLSRIEASWTGAATATADPVFGRLAPVLDAPIEPARTAILRICGERSAHVWRNLSFPMRSLARARVRLDRQLQRAGGSAVYLNTSHTMLDRPQRFDWLKQRGLPAALFLHDAIPLDYPEFVSPAGHARHKTRLDLAARIARLLIVNSADTRTRITAHLAAAGLPFPDISVVPLGVTAPFLRPEAELRPRPAAGTTPYFVVVGTIEPRKNLLFLLEVWRRLTERHGDRCPRLVVAGRRGWENENILDVLERSRALAPYVCEVSDLSDAGLAAVMRGAAGLLAPSSVEGYGLPIAEALSLGVPVLASDIAAHSENFGPYACLLDGIDGPAWVRAITALANPADELGAALRARAAGFRAKSWPEHVAGAIDALRGALCRR